MSGEGRFSFSQIEELAFIRLFSGGGEGGGGRSRYEGERVRVVPFDGETGKRGWTLLSLEKRVLGEVSVLQINGSSHLVD